MNPIVLPQIETSRSKKDIVMRILRKKEGETL